ncbi:alpha/beta fold hydrolase [Paracoccus sp. S-4012]|uniref:alpha/beta fold hydrolase n=1 Tax=Paracoccus sp. S-4012 TaxID=2665648 RepID=UPI0018A1C51F|nr:alpha/beta hydrolase [Paracoccus sp. S-4012]
MSNPLLLAVSALAILASANALSAQTEPAAPTRDHVEIALTSGFDHIGAEVHSVEVDGRTSYYIDDGDREGRPVVFLGGQGTSLAAFQLTEFNRSTRLALGLRMISVERNGFGESPLDPERGYADYVQEVLGVLNHLGVDRFAIVAISGGGAYAAHLAAAEPERVLSLHAAAAVSRTLPSRDTPDCSVTLEQKAEELTKYTHHPKDWWGVPGSPVLIIPGWQAEAYADATRSFYVNGQMGDSAALAVEYLLPCSEDAVVDASRIAAPTYLYWGEEDTAVPPAQMEDWQEAIPNVVRATSYPGQGHTVQYRHWDQVLADIAGFGEHRVVCRDGETLLVPEGEVSEDELLGNCAWH